MHANNMQPNQQNDIATTPPGTARANSIKRSFDAFQYYSDESRRLRSLSFQKEGNGEDMGATGILFRDTSTTIAHHDIGTRRLRRLLLQEARRLLLQEADNNGDKGAPGVPFRDTFITTSHYAIGTKVTVPTKNEPSPRSCSSSSGRRQANENVRQHGALLSKETQEVMLMQCAYR